VSESLYLQALGWGGVRWGSGSGSGLAVEALLRIRLYSGRVEKQSLLRVPGWQLVWATVGHSELQ
jgi:hypothetical protein